MAFDAAAYVAQYRGPDLIGQLFARDIDVGELKFRSANKTVDAYKAVKAEMERKFPDAGAHIAELSISVGKVLHAKNHPKQAKACYEDGIQFLAKYMEKHPFDTRAVEIYLSLLHKWEFFAREK